MFYSKMAKSYQKIKRFKQKSIFDDKGILQWVHHILSIEACDAIRPELNCFILIIICIAKLSGFPP